MISNPLTLRLSKTLSIKTFHTLSNKTLKTLSMKMIPQSVSLTRFSTKSKLHGSYHWSLERGLSLVSVPLMGTAFVMGSIPTVDFLLGVVMPLHCHIGFDAVITDYYPKHSSPGMNSFLSWSLRAATLLALYGCYSFNTNDVGLTALVSNLWTGKSNSSVNSSVNSSAVATA